MQTNNPEFSFNSDHTIRQYAHGLLLESQFQRSSTDCWAIRAKIRQNGRLGGRSGETGSRNMVATPKMNFLTLFTPSETFSLGRTVLPQYKTLQTDRQTDDRRQTTHCTKGSTDSTVGQKLHVRTSPNFLCMFSAFVSRSSSGSIVIITYFRFCGCIHV